MTQNNFVFPPGLIVVGGERPSQNGPDAEDPKKVCGSPGAVDPLYRVTPRQIELIGFKRRYCLEALSPGVQEVELKAMQRQLRKA